MNEEAKKEGRDGTPHLLVVDDDESIRTQLKWALAEDHSVLLAEDRPSALEMFRKHKPPVVILDLGLPPHPDDVREGFLTLEAMLEEDPLAKVVVSSGRGEREHAMEAVAQGAYDFLPKPVDLDSLKVVLRRAYYLATLEREHRDLNERFTGQAFEGMVGSSPEMLRMFESIRKVATTDAPVLIEGENGTGKEVAAKALHRLSSRAEAPFVPINCGAIPENLLESELFGHEKGAFTGAHIQREGRIEKAAGGTLFLDEIGEMPLLLQVKLLRFLQEHKVERVGGREEIDIDVRVVAATNRDLQAAMKEGQFREDLYYRLGVVVVSLPPLREREGDIPLLAKFFLQSFAEGGKQKITGFTKDALAAMEGYRWPGNVRELENRIRRAVIMAEGTKIKRVDLDLGDGGEAAQGMSLKEARELVERNLITRTLERNKQNISRTASALKISRPTLYELMEKLGIEKAEVKQALPYVLPYCVFVLAGSAAGVLGELEYLIYPLKTVMVVALLLYWRRVYREIRLSFSLLPVVAGFLVFLAWIGLTEFQPFSTFHPPETGYDPRQGGALLTTILIMFRLGGSVLVVPVFEELFIRSFVLRFLINPDDFSSVAVGAFTRFSFFGSIILFALGHHSWEWPAAVVTGVVYTLLLYRRKQLFDCIVAHAVTNLALGIYVLTTGSWGYW